MRLKTCQMKARRAGLACTQQFAFASQLQVFLGDQNPSSVSRMMLSRARPFSLSGPL